MSDSETMSLPIASDTCRTEARVIREAAARAAEQYMLVHDAVREAHKRIGKLEEENARLLKALNEIGFDLNLTGSGRALVAREAIGRR